MNLILVLVLIFVIFTKSCVVTSGSWLGGENVKSKNRGENYRLNLYEVYWLLVFHSKFYHYTSISELGRGLAPVCSGEQCLNCCVPLGETLQ